jgi:hypothetical protein
VNSISTRRPCRFISGTEHNECLLQVEIHCSRAGEFPGAPDPHGWTPGVPLMPDVYGGRAWGEAADFEKPSLDGKRMLRVKRHGKFWMPERSTRLSGRYKYRQIEALVFPFGEMPIWTRTQQAAMRLAEYCDPIPSSPMAIGFWLPVFTCS